MNDFRLRIALILFFFVGYFPAFSQFYVAESGSDNNPGTIGKPFRTIQKAANIMKAGDTCFIRQGRYFEQVKLIGNGSVKQKMVFSAYKDEVVEITSGVRLESWQLYKPNVYFKVIKAPVYQLNINDRLAPEATYPNINQESIFDFSKFLEIRSFENGSLKFANDSFPINYWKGANIIVLCHLRWVTLNGEIDYNDGDSVFCQVRSNKWNKEGYRKYIGEGLGYITGHFNALDTDGEWLWKEDTLFVFSSGDLNDKTIEAQTGRYAFIAAGKSNIVLQNIRFINSSVDLGAARNCLIDNCSFTNVSPFFTHPESFDRFMKSANDTFNYGISHWSGIGVKISGTGNTIRNSWIKGSWGDGISMGGFNNNIINCLIENCNRRGTDAGGIAVIGVGHKIIHNTIKNCGRSGILHNDSRNIKILYNEIYNCGLLTMDNGLTYCFKTNGENSEIAYNWLHDNKALQLGAGVFVDNYSSGFLVHHNVIWNCYVGISTSKPSNQVRLYHNSVFNCELNQGTTGYIHFSEIKNQPVINNWSNQSWTIGTEFHNNLMTEIRFSDIKDGLFIFPAENSQAIDFGILIPCINDNFSGKAPDAGAYEYGLKPWIPGSSLAKIADKVKD